MGKTVFELDLKGAREEGTLRGLSYLLGWLMLLEPLHVGLGEESTEHVGTVVTSLQPLKQFPAPWPCAGQIIFTNVTNVVHVCANHPCWQWEQTALGSEEKKEAK